MRNGCFKVLRCIRYAEKHKANECDKLENQAAKCINFNEDHLTNYRGCMVGRELQKMGEEATKRNLTKKSLLRQWILAKLNQQERSNKIILDRLNKVKLQLEYLLACINRLRLIFHKPESFFWNYKIGVAL